MELPYVLECGVSAAPDEVRGQVVKASIVLVKGTEGTEALKKEIQTYVKTHTAPYKYPRIVEFRDALPKTHAAEKSSENVQGNLESEEMRCAFHRADTRMRRPTIMSLPGITAVERRDIARELCAVRSAAKRRSRD